MKKVLLRAAGAFLASALLASCGDDVHVCTNPGGGCPPRDFDVTISVETTGQFGALQFDISHLGSGGGFVGQNDKVECVALVDAIVASNYPGERTVHVGLISLTGISTPADVMRCGFRTSEEELRPSDFEIEVTDASDPDSNQVKPKPTVVVSSIVQREAQ